MGLVQNNSVFVNKTDLLSFPLLGLDEAVIQVGSQEVDVTNAKVKLRVVVVHSYSVIESEI